MPSRLAVLFTALAWFAAAAPASAQATPRRAITHEDLWLMKRVGAPSPSPDGRWVVFSVSDPAYDENAQSSDLWLVAADGATPPRRLTGTSARESGVDWSADGTRLAFSSRRDGDEVEQVYVLALAGGDAARVTSSATGARSPRFSPDGRRIAYVSDVHPGAASEEENRAAALERRARRWNARIYEGFPIRNWDRWLDERLPQLFVQELPQPGALPAAARNLLAGSMLVESPGYAGRESDGGAELDPVWSPDGGQSVVRREHRPGPGRIRVHEHATVARAACGWRAPAPDGRGAFVVAPGLLARRASAGGAGRAAIRSCLHQD